MRRLTPFALAAAAAALAIVHHAPAAAQSDILLRLRSGSPLGDRFRVDSAGGVVAVGQLGIGIIPASGPGYRMMWYPFKGAFRAGGTDDGGAGNYWDDANVGFYSWAGGNLTKAGAFATFAFGDQVEVTGVDGAAFGASNRVSGTAGFSTGAQNNCAGFACIAMGYKVTANANYAVAMGHRASAAGREGAWVISDYSGTSDSTLAAANNSWTSRFSGGYRLFTNAARTTGVFITAGSGSWSAFSDANHKEAFLPVDSDDILARVRSLPVTTWRYIGEADRSARHIGPMAQDWQRAFGFSGDSTTINMSDFDGVNLAAIQALERRTAEQASEIQALREQNATLQARLERLEALVPPRSP
jgi:hypothetical protein